jgi:Cu(I)/Ag(I) efflux system membrane fusion protein
MPRAVKTILILALMALLVAAAFVAWQYLPQRQTATRNTGMWTCSMHPQVRLPAPGQCPICGMNLIPVEQLSGAQAQMKEQAGLQTESIIYRELAKEIRTYGKLDYNERQVAYITARIAGRVDRVYADFTGIQVKKNDHLVDIYSPELVVTVQNLLDAQKANNPGLAEISRERLRLWGILPEQIKEIEKSGKRTTHLTIFAPIGGTVIEKSVREQQYVKEGDQLYRIADLDPIWLYLDIYESDLGWVRFGQTADVTVEAYPGETFRGTVTFIDPFLDDKTRTVKARVNLENHDRRLKPAMYAHATIRVRLRPDGTPEPTGLEGKFVCPMHPEVVREEPGRCPICAMPLEQVPGARPMTEQVQKSGVLSVPVSAVLDTGRRKVAYREAEGGAYELVELQVGPRAEGLDGSGQPAGYYPVLKGLKEGDRVVVRGGYLLDSQRQIEGMPSLLYPKGQSAASLHAGHGATPSPPAAPPQGQHRH